MTSLCFLHLVPVAAFPIESIPPGESRTLSYTIALPPDTTDERVDQLIFTVGEESLIRNEVGEIVRDESKPLMVSEDMIVKAKGALYAGSPRIRVLRPPDLAVVDFTVNTTAFELDQSHDNTRPVFVVNARFVARGGPMIHPPPILFSLQVPGHEFDVLNYVPGSSRVTYDSRRGIGLRVTCDSEECNEDWFNSDPESKCSTRECWNEVRPYTYPCRLTNTCHERTEAEAIWHPGVEVDGTFKLYLTPYYIKLLSETLNHPAQNPGLNSANELPGTLTVRIGDRGGRFDPDPSNDSKTINIVFMAPTGNKIAGDNDPTEPAATEPSDDGKKAKDYPNGLYPEQDNLTPTVYEMFGTNWAGASYQVRNITSKERLYQAVVKQALLADNFVKLHLFEHELYLLKVSADIDFGTRRPLANNTMSGEVLVPNIPRGGFDMSLFGSGGAQLVNTLYSFDFVGAEDCKKEGHVETCLVIKDAEENDEFGSIEWDLNLPSNDKSFRVEARKEKTVCKGPLCFTAGMGVSFTVGIKGTLGFFRDSTYAPEYFAGIQATIGPYAEAEGSASGTLSVVLASIAINGSVNFLDAALTPTLRMGIMQELREEPGTTPCWLSNTGHVSFEGPATLKALSGRVWIDAYVGSRIRTFFGTINLRKRVLTFTLVNWAPALNRSWLLWSESRSFRGGPGLCEGVPSPYMSWKSPIGCKTISGADAYCPMSIPNWNRHYDRIPKDYTGRYWGRLYTSASQCGTIIVDGNTEPAGMLSLGDTLTFAYGPRRNPVPWPWGWGSSYQDTEYITWIYPEDFFSCRWITSRRGDNEIHSFGGTVTCGDGYYSSSTYKIEQAFFWGPYSGLFNNTRFTVCNPYEKDEFRWIDVYFATDGTDNRSGVTVKFEPSEGEESAIYSDTTWWVENFPAHHLENDPALRKWNQIDFARDIGFIRPVDSGPINAAPWHRQAQGIFDYHDGQKARWIWYPYADMARAPQGHVFFRRPFVAAKEEYTGHVYCDNSCDVFLDGEKVASSPRWEAPTEFRITTQKGHLHMIAVQAYNSAVSPAGLNFMMK